ncbi:hypothetical protein AB0M02_40820 [Actinoplanes sp. NPDC051861]|uniref:hypothetical protein n=1 Tax=Actinoplanes sp. NPDC051861 TaxID=3155170 RepID=UPI00341A1E3B
MLTMTLFLLGLLVAVSLMVYVAGKASRENRHQRHAATGYIGGSAYHGTGETGFSGDSCDNSGSGGGWGGGDFGGGSSGGGDGGGGGGSC